MGKYVTILSKSRILGVDLLILVTLGTQAEPFTRLLDAIEKSNIKDEIIVQAGNTPYTSNKMKINYYAWWNRLNSRTIKKG